MKLPNGDRAVVPEAKLLRYALSPESNVGRHKAIVFASALGITRDNWEILLDALLLAASEGEAQLEPPRQHGIEYVIDFDMAGPRGRATVRSMWIIRPGDDRPHLSSCYVRTGGPRRRRDGRV